MKRDFYHCQIFAARTVRAAAAQAEEAGRERGRFCMRQAVSKSLDDMAKPCHGLLVAYSVSFVVLRLAVAAKAGRSHRIVVMSYPLCPRRLAWAVLVEECLHLAFRQVAHRLAAV